jgi:small nuclear ribonucleoprotein (snRNP)-like protein
LDLTAFIAQWRGQEVVAFCGPIKYRGILESVLDGTFLVMNNVAVVNPSAGETAEYQTCILNVAEVSGLAYQEVVGRGGAASEEY